MTVCCLLCVADGDMSITDIFFFATHVLISAKLKLVCGLLRVSLYILVCFTSQVVFLDTYIVNGPVPIITAII